MKKGTAAHYKEHKEKARALAEQKLAHYTTQYAHAGYVFAVTLAEDFATGKKRLSVRNQRTRWGSCSRTGNLNFNYKIALLPEPLADYIIAHELCHLGEFNHSQAFWDLVAVAIPDYRERRAELRRIERAIAHALYEKEKSQRVAVIPPAVSSQSWLARLVQNI